MAFTKTLVNPEKCLIIQKKDHNYNSSFSIINKCWTIDESIKYQVKLFDDIGEYGLLPFYPMRYNAIISNE